MNDFNLDLMLVEKVLKGCDLHVKSALVMPQLTKQALNRETCFVMLLEDNASNSDVVSGFDLQQYITERFAVIIGIRSAGDSTGVNATAKLQALIKSVKQGLIGLTFDTFEPIEFEVGRVIEVNRDTQNILYQLQFKTAHTAVTTVKYYD